MSEPLVLRRQLPIVKTISNIGLIVCAVFSVLSGPGIVFGALIGVVGLILLVNDLRNLKTRRIEVNNVGVYDNGLLIVEAKDVAKAEAVGVTLVVHTNTGAKHHLPAFDISRHGRRQFVAALNDNPRQSISDEAQRTAHV